MTIHQCRACGATHQRPQPYCENCEYMTRQDAMKRLDMSLNTFKRLVTAGKIHTRRVSERKIYILRAEVDALLA